MRIREGYTHKLLAMMPGLYLVFNKWGVLLLRERGGQRFSLLSSGIQELQDFREQCTGIFMSLHSRKFGSETHLFKPICLLVPFNTTSDKASVLLWKRSGQQEAKKPLHSLHECWVLDIGGVVGMREQPSKHNRRLLTLWRLQGPGIGWNAMGWPRTGRAPVTSHGA